jgi:tetratricopeptide (TPR) repeat protein
VELREKDATAWYNLAFANRRAGHFADAARAYGRYVQLAPDDPDGYFGFAESLRQSGHASEARQAYQTYLSKESRPSEEKWKAVARQRVAELGEPAAPPQAPPAPATPPPTSAAVHPPAAPPTAAAEPPSSPPSSPPGAAASAVPSQPGAMAPAAPSQPPVQRPDPAALTADGDAALAANDVHAALFAYQDAVMSDGKYVPARVKLGHVYARMGHPLEAVEQWNRALQLDPRNTDAQTSLAGMRQKIAEATPRPAAVAAPAPVSAPVAAPVRPDEAGAKAHYSKGVALVNDRKYQEALSELDQAIAQRPGFAVALVARGSARVGLGQYEAAVADYSAAQKADPSLAAPLFGLAEAFRALGQAEKAADFYRRYASSGAPDAQPRLKQYALENAQALAPR